MAKFLWHGSYSERGTKALVEQGGTQRCAEVEQAVTAMGGTLEAMYFAFGDDDYYAIVDLPDNVSGAAVSLAAAQVGAVRLKTIVLLTAEDLDRAAARAHEYKGPGARPAGADGALWSDLDRPPRPTGWPPPAGSSRAGIGKLTLGGGLGHLMRRYRLTVDNLLCVDLVTADWTVTPPMHWRPICPELPPGSVLSGSRSAARRWPRAHQTHLDQTLTTVLTVVADCASSRSELVLDAVLPAAG